MRLDARSFTAIGSAQIGDDGKQWIETLPTVTAAKNGPYRFTVTRDDLEVYAKSIADNADRIPVDFDHRGAKDIGDTRAAGWFTGQARVDDRSDGAMLMAEVQWTPRAAKEIQDGEWRFTSAEFTFQQRNPVTRLMTKAKAIRASTVTNRPFFKDLVALASELDDEDLAAIADEIEEFTVLAASKEPYGDVTYADAGLQSDGKKRYPLDTEEHIRAAWSYINQAKNAGKYTSEQLASIKSKIRAAMKRIGADVATANEGEVMELKVLAAALGLAEDATEDEIKAAAEAAKTESEKLATVQKELDELKATAGDKTELEQLRTAVEEQKTLRLTDRRDMILAKAVEDRRIDPAQSTVLAEQFGTNVDGLEKMVAMFEAKPRTARGSGGDAPTLEGVKETDVALAADQFEYDNGSRTVTAADGQLELHVMAEKILADRGKHAGSYTPDEYLAAYAEAERTASVAA